MKEILLSEPSIKEDKKSKRNIRTLYLIILAYNFNFATSILVPFVLMYGKISFSEFMIIQSYFTIMVVMLEAPSGAIADYFSHKFSLFLAGICQAIAIAIYSCFPSFWIFFIGETIFAFSGSLISGTDHALLYENLKRLNKADKITKYQSNYTAFQTIGLLTASFLAGFIGEYINLQFAVFITVIPSILSGICCLRIKKIPIPVDGDTYITVLKKGIKEIFRKKETIILVFHRCIIGALVMIFGWAYQKYFLIRGVEVAIIGVFFTFFAVLRLLGNKFTSFLVNKLKNSKIKLSLDLTTILTGIMFILLGFPFPLFLSLCFMMTIEFFGMTRKFYYLRGLNRLIEVNRATAHSTISTILYLFISTFYFVVGMLDIDVFTLYIIIGILIIGISLTSLTFLKSRYL